MIFEEEREITQGGGDGQNQGENKPDILQYLPKANADTIIQLSQ